MPSSPIWKGGDALIEDPGSPSWVWGDRIACTRVFRGQYAIALAGAPMKGALGTGESAGLRVSESRLVRERGGVGLLTIVYETVGQPSQGATLPADEITIEPNKIERALKKHPRYAGLSTTVLQQIKDAVENGNESTRAQQEAKFNGNATALELFRKLAREFTFYPLYPPVVKITTYHWIAPAISAGGFRQAPPIATVTLPAGIDWLREGDSLRWNGAHWVLLRSWVGAPDLDPEIYPPG